jgi:phospholipase/carboxylesterase
MPEGERGGTAVVLLHGFGARADDLLPFAQRLMRPRSRFFVPAGPLPRGSEGRAWWYFDERERSLREWDGQVPLAHQPHEQVLRVREALQTLLASVREHYAPERLALAGFSQGGMLTLDVALASEPSVDRAAVLSGAFIAESMEALRRERTSRPSFFLSHGRADRIVPFRAAEGTHSLLTGAGFPVAFEAFEGGHEIPPQVLAKVANFVYG